MIEILAFKAQREAARVLEHAYEMHPEDPREGLEEARSILETALKRIQKRPKSTARTSMCAKLFDYKAEIKKANQKGGSKPNFVSAQDIWNQADNDFLIRWIGPECQAPLSMREWEFQVDKMKEVVCVCVSLVTFSGHNLGQPRLTVNTVISPCERRGPSSLSSRKRQHAGSRARDTARWRTACTATFRLLKASARNGP